MKKKARRRRGRHIPERQCVVCRARRPKRELIRVARLEDGQVTIDQRGTGPGRGAYVCPNWSCWLDKALTARLGYALKTRLTPADGEQLVSRAAELLPEPVNASPPVPPQP